MVEARTKASPPSTPLEKAVRKVGEISTLPHVALRVMEVANDPKSGARELKEVMESDASLSARVLRSVNSSAYATRSKITNLQQAIAYLGIRQVRNLAMAASVSELFKKEEKIGPYDRRELWRHLVSVGICARLVAMQRGLANFEDIFLSGLLHDIGIVLEDEHLHQPFAAAVLSLGDSGEEKTLPDVEAAHLGFDHTQLAFEVAEQWRFPEGVTAAIRHHHNSQAYRGEHIGIVRCVEVANFICSLKGMTSVGVNLTRFPRAAINGLALTKDDVAVLLNDLDREISQSQNLFQM
jgi:putative nucleotidyltransferase with HDIG domain